MSRVFFAVLVGLLVVGLAFSAERVVLLPFATTNVREPLSEVALELFKVELVDRGYEVLVDTAVCRDAACAGEAARRNGAPRAIFGSLIGMGEKVVVTFYVVRSDDRVAYTARATAKTQSDLDAVVRRLVDAFVSERTVEEAATIDNITEVETEEPRRRAEYYTAGAKVGAFVPFGGSEAKNASLMGGEAFGLYETPDFVVNASVGYYDFDERELFMPIDISVYKLFSHGDFCPYAGGGLGVHIVLSGDYYNEDDEWVSGSARSAFGISIGGGILLFRTYSFHVDLGARYWVMFSSPVYHGISLAVGLSRKVKTTGYEDQWGSFRSCCWW